jgi:hypothetical protein
MASPSVRSVGLVMPVARKRLRSRCWRPASCDPCLQRDIVAAGARHVDRIELEQAEPLDDLQDRRGLGQQRPRRRQQVTSNEEAAGMIGRR